MPYSTSVRKWTAGGLGVPDLNQFGADLRADLGAPAATGAAVARLLATRFADTINFLDYVLPIDKDATNGLNRAMARAQSLNAPCIVDAPPGTFMLSAMIHVAVSGNQSIFLRGGGSAVTRFIQTADADGIRVEINNYGPAFFDGGAFNVQGLTLEQAAPGSTGKAGLVISSTGVAGNTGKPLVLDDLCFVGRDPGPRWNLGLYFERFGNIAYVSRVSVIGCGGGISLNGTSTDYMASAYVRDVTVIGGASALVLGNYLQGAHFENFNSVNTQVCVQCTPTAGVNEEISFVNSYLMGRSIFRPSGAGYLNSLRFVGNYFDVSNPQPGDTHVTFWDAGTVILSGNTFNGQLGPPGANQTGLFFGGGTGGDTLIMGNQFQNYGAGGFAGFALSIAATAGGLNFVGNSFHNCPTPVKDLGPGNSFVATTWEGGISQMGPPAALSSAVATLNMAVNLPSRWPAGATAASAFPGRGLSIGWSLTGGGGEVDLMLGREGGAGGLNIYSVGANGLIDGTGPIVVLDRFGALALSDLNVAGTGSVAGAWTTYAATIASSSGALATATASVRYKKLGRLVFFVLSASITANGTGAGQINVSLPFANNAVAAVMLQSRDLTSNNAVSGFIGMSAASMAIVLTANGGYPNPNGSAGFAFSGVYEASV